MQVFFFPPPRSACERVWWKVGGGQDWKQVQQEHLLPGHTAGAAVKVTSSFPGVGSAALAFLVSAGYEGGRVNNGRAFNHPTFSSFKKKSFVPPDVWFSRSSFLVAGTCLTVLPACTPLCRGMCVYASPVGEFAIPVSPAWWTGLGGVGRGTSASSPGHCYLVASARGSPSAPWSYRPSQFEIFICFSDRVWVSKG